MSASRRSPALLDPRLEGAARHEAISRIDLDYPPIYAVEPEARPILPGLTATVWGLVEPQFN